MTQRGLWIVVLSTFIVAGGASRAATLTSQQITPSNDSISESWSIRNSSTSRGRILFVGSNDNVRLYDGTGIVPVQSSIVNEEVNTTVFMLGSGASGTSVIGGWRRDDGYGNVSVDGPPVARVTLNPEAVSINGGCVFMVLQDGSLGAHVFKINPSDGTRTKLSSGDVDLGALRVASSGCSKAAWSWQNDNASAMDIQYWNGTTTTTVAEDVLTRPSFAGNWIVYAKSVFGIAQVFAIDTAASLTPVQLSSETDPVKYLEPQTDGRHVVWYRANLNGASPSIVLNGGQTFPTGPLAKISSETPFQLDRGQLFWKTASNEFQYDDGRETHSIDKAPATTFELPWLTDGYIAFLGTTATGGADKDVFRITGTAPADSSVPLPPLLVTATPAGVLFDSVLGATSYNAYIALVPGVTKDNYASLAGGQKLTGVTSGFSVTGIPQNTTYYVVVTAVDGTGESSSSRQSSATFIGNFTWQPVGNLSSINFFSVAADAANASYVYAGATGRVYRSINGGFAWTETLTSATTGGTRVPALAASGTRVLASTMTQGDIWRSNDRGATWSRVVDGTADSLFGSLAINPANADVAYAGDFTLTTRTVDDSTIIKTVDGGTNWTHTPFAPFTSDMKASTISIDPVTPTTLYAGSNGTPNVARSTNSGASWSSKQIPSGGSVRSLSINPSNSGVIYAATHAKGVFKSFDGGGSWVAKNNGLAGVSDDFIPIAEFNSIVVDPTNPNLLHLGAGNGYWMSIDGGETWYAGNHGFGSSPAWINALAITPGRRLIAATESGLFMLSLAAAPTVGSISPATGNIGGGTAVTITGTGFESGATVTFGGASATNVVVVNATTVTATTPAHAAGVVSAVVTNPDMQSGTLAGAFNYVSAPDRPTGLTATAQSTTSVQVTWSASAGAASYRVFRRAAGGGYTQVGTPSQASFTDTVAAAAAYAYRVQAVTASTDVSLESAPDVATTMTFANEPLAAGVSIQAVHLSHLRTAVNYVRALAGIGSAGFTDAASAGVTVKAVHITELRTALDDALSTLNIGLTSYTDSGLSGVAAKAVHVQEIRNRLK